MSAAAPSSATRPGPPQGDLTPISLSGGTVLGPAPAPARVLVTGGTGFLGRPTLPLLLAAGHEVHVVSSRPGVPAFPAGVRAHRADLLDPAARAALLDAVAPTHLLHLAWHYRPRTVWQAPENLAWLEASVGLLRAFAAAGGRRAVLAGTCFEYDPGAAVCAEHATPLRPTTLYGACKAALGTVAAVAGPSVAWARIFLAHGPDEHPDRLVPAVVRRLLRGEPAPVSHGRQVRDYLSSEDIASALVALLASEATGPVNVGSGAAVTLRELVGTLAELVGRPELVRFGAVTPPFAEPATIAADTTRLRDEVGWRARHDLRAGLERTVRWWAEHESAPLVSST